MSTSKHEKTAGEGPFTSDLERNPGIGQSGGTFATGGSLQDIAGDNTELGDIENDAGPNGEVSENSLGRTNK
jgi:hypothetical protein